MQARKKRFNPMLVSYILVSAYLGYVVVLFFIIGVANSPLGAGKLLTPGVPYDTWKVALYAHLITGSIAFGVGPMQFLKNTYTTNIKRHRMLGKIYVYSIFASIPFGFYLALYATGGRWGTIAFTTLDALWLVTTFMGVRRAIQRNITSHRAWMVRSYAITCVFASFRVVMPLYLAFGVDVDHAFPYGVFTTIVLNLLVAEWFLRRKKRQPLDSANSKTA